MRVKDKDLRYALGGAPTAHWRGVFNGSWALIQAGTVSVYEGVRIVDDTAWRNAMQKLWRLPSGGRHVAEARRQLSWAINRALNFEGESK
jgi:hypothetical protein